MHTSEIRRAHLLRGKNRADLPWAPPILLGLGKLGLRNLHGQRPPPETPALTRGNGRAERRLSNGVRPQVRKLVPAPFPSRPSLPVRLGVPQQCRGLHRATPMSPATVQSMRLCRACGLSSRRGELRHGGSPRDPGRGLLCASLPLRPSVSVLRDVSSERPALARRTQTEFPVTEDVHTRVSAPRGRAVWLEAALRKPQGSSDGAAARYTAVRTWARLPPRRLHGAGGSAVRMAVVPAAGPRPQLLAVRTSV